ncbi:MAG: MBL fold metallo-hydrolase [Tindallia sp. MSAO_Bac2]|nr:MAG: MBL fold metallo-hydrolase [Tindallia sp. MSAO_Bac2]
MEKLITGPMQVNTYLVADKETGECIVIDPGGNAQAILNLVEEKNWQVKKIVLTHGHGDHIGALVQLKELTQVPVAIHHEDAHMIEDGQRNFTAMMGTAVEITADELLNDGDEIKLGESVIKIIHTPGHTQGGICLLADDMLFSGDTLFMQSIGRTDLEGGNLFQLLGSIKKKLLVLSETVRVFPGHGPETNIKMEKMSNPHLG